jgi:BMFP domain-containing protein YqiC
MRARTAALQARVEEMEAKLEARAAAAAAAAEES